MWTRHTCIYIHINAQIHTYIPTSLHTRLHIYEFFTSIPIRRPENDVGQTKRLVEETSTQLLKQWLHFLAQSSIVQCNMYESQSVQQKCITNQMNREISNLRSCRTETGAGWAKAQRLWQMTINRTFTVYGQTETFYRNSFFLLFFAVLLWQNS